MQAPKTNGCPDQLDHLRIDCFRKKPFPGEREKKERDGKGAQACELEK